MDTLVILIALTVLPLGIWIVLRKPEVLAIIFFTITIANINFSLPGVPLNIRAILGLLLFARHLFLEKDNMFGAFLSDKTKFIIFFILYTLLITEVNDITTFDFIKTSALTFISIYLGYYYVMVKKSTSFLKISLTISGLLCFIDLAYTYIFVGSFPVQRVYQRLLNVPLTIDERGDVVELVNWNFYGMVCGAAFIVIFNDFINGKKTGRLLLLMLPLMFVGVLMSTSRSSLLGIIFAALFLIGREIRQGRNAKMLLSMLFMSVAVLILSLFVFVTLQDTMELDSEFIDKITMRLIDEPIAVFRKNLGLSYNAQSLDAMDWRKEASADAFNAFMGLEFPEQLFGIGFWGYVVRDLGHTNLPPHNGFLMVLVEYGMVGFVFYTWLVGSVIVRSVKINAKIPPLVTSLLFIIVYCIGQNEELTSAFTFLFVTTIIAENRLIQKGEIPAL
jgi:O-antigen ligase